MRRPSFASGAERWAWWEAAIAAERPTMVEHEPQTGFYKVRRWRGGPFAPARVVWEPALVDPVTGELIADEIVRAEIAGWEVDPWESWTWMAKHPVTEAEWRWLKAMSTLSPRRSRNARRPWWERSPRPPM